MSVSVVGFNLCRDGRNVFMLKNATSWITEDVALFKMDTIRSHLHNTLTAAFRLSQ